MTNQPVGRSAAEQLQELLLTSADITEFLDAFTRTIADSLSRNGEEIWCAITLLREKKAATVASSSPRAAALDEIQYAFGDGPCLTAAREHTLVHVPDMAAEPRWGDYHEAAAAAGIRSVLAVPFELAGEGRAGLNIYSDRTHVYDDTAIATVQREVLQASHALRLAVRLAHHRDTEAHLTAAMENRTTIDLAVGIIMGQNRCSQDEAIEILKAASSHRNLKLRELAADLVTTVGQGPITTHFNH